VVDTLRSRGLRRLRIRYHEFLFNVLTPNRGALFHLKRTEGWSLT
jgi:hypothetical protein